VEEYLDVGFLFFAIRNELPERRRFEQDNKGGATPIAPSAALLPKSPSLTYVDEEVRTFNYGPGRSCAALNRRWRLTLARTSTLAAQECFTEALRYQIDEAVDQGKSDGAHRRRFAEGQDPRVTLS